MVYVQLFAFPLLAAGALWTGMRMARSSGWWVGVLVPFVVFGVLILAHRTERLRFAAPMAWVVDADWGPLIMTGAIGTVFGTLLPKLPRRRTRILVAVMTALTLLNYGLLPAALPLAARPSLAASTTTLDSHGVCLQSHSYTCGPAAAVTCLARLGIPADESSLAIDSRCAPLLGTDGHLLAAAISNRYPTLHATYRYVPTLENLHPPAITDMVLPRIGGHYVAILEIRPTTILLGDPLTGLTEMPRPDFLRSWQHAAIEFSRP